MKSLKKKYFQTYFLVRAFGAFIRRSINLATLKAEWKLKNPNNDTYPVKYFSIDLVSVGDHCYGPIDVYSFDTQGEGLIIGKYCSIAKDVRFILGGNHRTDCLMTFPVMNKFISPKVNESFTKGKIVLEDDVWIGVGATILSGVRIGQGCAIAAGSVVTKSFPPFSIIGGNPAKIIKMRFNETTIAALQTAEITIGVIEPSFISQNIELFDKQINEETVQSVLSQISK